MDRASKLTSRRASCSCGQLHLTADGEPVRISVCHCLACQQRTGSVFGAQARFHRDNVEGPEGRSTAFIRIGDSGNEITFHFCPLCGTTLYWQIKALPDYFVVALGAFADPNFPPPRHSVYESRAHAWAKVLAGAQIEHLD
jgi:hypothetical protein